jgi:uncharacterized repeat protein (TIGR02543 family)
MKHIEIRKKALSLILTFCLLLSLLPGLSLTVCASSNSAPTVANTSVTLPTIAEDVTDSSNAGITISSILNLAAASDVDGNTMGIAVTLVDDSNGMWELCDTEGTWWSITKYHDVTSITDSNAYLIPDGFSIRFLPGADFNGQAFFTFRVWDGTSGSSDTVVDTSGSNHAGSTAFSAGMATAAITVTAVNDTPQIHKYSTGNVLNFDGSNDYVSVPDPGLNNDSFTVEGWIYARSANTYSRFFDFGKGPGDTGDDGRNIIVQIDGTAETKGDLRFEVWNGTDRATDMSMIETSSPFTLNQWVYVSAVYNSATQMGYLYCNGSLEAKGSMKLTPNTTIIRDKSYFGRSNWTADEYFNGQMHSIAVWKEARTAGEVARDMNASFSGAEPNLVLFYPLNDTASSTTAQSTTGSNSGSLLNYSSSGGTEASTANEAMIVNDSTFDYQVSDSAGVNIPVGQMYLKDVDAGAAGVALTLSATNGTLALNTVDGVSITGNGSSIMTVSGTIDDLNEALKTLTYLSSAACTDIITATVTDVGNTSSGGSLSASETIGVTVNAAPDPATTPTITVQPPSSVTVALGHEANFLVTVAGPTSGSSYTCQWQVTTGCGSTWSNISGETGSSYSISSTTKSDNGTQYRCYVYDATDNTSATSDKATLTVLYPIMKMANVTPANSSTSIDVNTQLAMTFNEDVSANSGNIYIDGPSSTVYTIPVTDSNVVINDNIVTITLPGSLDYITKYHILIDPGALVDTYGGAYAGLIDSMAWSFTTTAVPVSSSPAVVLGNTTLNSSDSRYYFDSAAVGGNSIQTILISFSSGVASGDAINLPAAPGGFTVSSTSASNSYTKRINIDTATTGTDNASAVQSYLRDIGFALDSTHTSQSVKVTLTTENVQCDTFYDIDTQHYYQFIPYSSAAGTTWVDAYNSVKSMTYMGRTGYLATITSYGEDTLVNSLSGGMVGWLGGTALKYTDTEPVQGSLYYEGFDTTNINSGSNWYWACGPERGNIFYNGRSSTRNGQTGTEPYYNWGANEPSNSNNSENCLTTLVLGFNGIQGTAFSWNDISYGSKYSTGTYDPKGCFVEYGNLALGSNEIVDTTKYASDGGTIIKLSYAATISGSPVSGQTLTATLTGASGSETLAYQWMREDTAIDKATGVTYKLTDDDVGYKIAVKITVDGSAAVTSPDVGPVTAALKPTLTATADNTHNCVSLTWTPGGTADHYMVYQKDSSETICQSIPVSTVIKVLNVYPDIDGSDSLNKWMDTNSLGSPKINGTQYTMTVTKTSLTEFNTNYATDLKISGGSYNYDVIYFGAWDENNKLELSTNAMKAVKAFIDYGGGCLLGHDTESFTHTNFIDLARTYLNMDVDYKGDWDTGGASSAYPPIGDEKVLVHKKGMLTNYPYSLGDVGTMLSTSLSHSYYEFAMGDVWFTYPSNTFGNQTPLADAEKSVSKGGVAGTNNFYLTTWNNCAAIQTGHSNGVATPDEQKILANTLYYLAQATKSTSATDHMAQDLAAPDDVISSTVAVQTSGDTALNWTAPSDNGSTYDYYVREFSSADGSSYVDSDTKSATVTAGVSKYFYLVDQSSNNPTASEVKAANHATAVSTNINAGTLPAGNYYVHIMAVDNAGNESGVTTASFTVQSVPPVAGSGDALGFDGTDDYVDLGEGNNTLILGNTFTEEAWVYPSETDDAYHGIIGNQIIAESSTRAPGIWVYDYNKVHMGFGSGTDWCNLIDPDAVLTTDEWNHIAAVYDGNTYYLYINGVLKAQKTLNATPCNTPVRFIGKVDNFFNGQLDEVKLWNTARTQAEIRSDMHSHPSSSETCLVGYWNFDEGSGSTASNSSSSGVDGTLTNMNTSSVWISSSAWQSRATAQDSALVIDAGYAPDGGSITLATGSKAPGNGTLSYNDENRTVTYIPTAGYYGSDSFIYTVTANGVTKSYEVHMTVVQKPVMTGPTGVTAAAGASATFSVTVSAPSTGLSYQWQKYDGSNWNNITSATDATYTIGSVAAGDARQYRCVVINTDGTISAQTTSDTATLMVTYSVTVTDNGNGTGSASPATATLGDDVTLTATPSTGYHFKDWQVISGGVTVTGNKFTMPAEAVEVKAVFEKTNYSVTVTDDGNGTGSASPVTATLNDEVTLTASPATGYHFKDWQVISGSVTITGNKFTMPAEAVKVKAVFEIDTYTATVNVKKDDAASSEPVTGVVELKQGGDTKATLTGGSGIYTDSVINGIYSVYVNGEDTGKTITIDNDTASVTVDYYTVSFSATDTGAASGSSISAAAGGSGISSGTAVLAGKQIVLTATGTGASYYEYFWSGSGANGQTADFVTISSLSFQVNVLCTVTGRATPATYSVSLNTNGGAIGSGSILSYTYGTGVKLPSDVTREGFIFAGWYTGSNFSGSAVTEISAADTGNKTFYAKWRYYTVNGTVVDEDSNTVHGATVTIRGNNITKQTTTTDADGKYSFSDIPKGAYNIIATYEVVTTTIIINVVDEDISDAEIVMPSVGTENSVLTVSDDTPDVVVGYLDQLFNSSDDTYVGQDSGNTVEIKLAVKEQSADDADGGTEILSLAGGQSIGMYLDMTLIKTMTGTTDSTKILSETDSLLKIIIPYDLSDKTNIKVYRVHNGTAEVMTKQAYSTDQQTSECYMVSTNENQVIVWARNFSTYAIAYSNIAYDSESTKYTVEATAGTGGSISPSGSASVTAGSSKTFTVTAEDGYAVSDVLVDGKSVGAVGSYTFINVKASHTISAVFAKVKGLPYYLDSIGGKLFIGFAEDKSGEMKYIAPEAKTVLFTPNSKNFTDISDHWGKSYIDFVTEREIFIGTGSNIFSPDKGMTRAMFATVIGRLYERSYGTPGVSEVHAFTDCDYESWYGSYIDWCSENGIINGIGGGLFEPNREITRQEMAAILYRFAELMKVSAIPAGAALSYPDSVNIAAWAEQAALYCQEAGILKGRDGSNFAPKGTATRAEVAAILERFIEKVV